jgi:SAM-dependent methyltransferase
MMVIDTGWCAICGHVGEFVAGEAPTRETHTCQFCSGSLRYRAQANAIASTLGRPDSSLADLIREPGVRELAIFEPGIVGPFRRLLPPMANYVNSYFWPDVALGDERDGVRCEDLRQLTFPDGSFDLVISSDIFEHVRGPEDGFREIFRVLKPGGHHVFTVPMEWPYASTSVTRVDYSGPADVHLLPPVYHRSPHDPQGSLVHTDFGMDLPERLRELGFQTTTHHGYRNVVTFCARKPVPDGRLAIGGRPIGTAP